MTAPSRISSPNLFILAGQMRQLIWSAMAITVFSATGAAQIAPQGASSVAPQTGEPSTAPAPSPAQDQAPLVVTAGARFVLILTHPVDSKFMKSGDQVYAVTTSPVSSEGEVAIPAGSFVEGRVEKLARRGTRAELVMQSVSIIMPDGIVSNIPGPLTIESVEGTAWRNPSGGEGAAILSAPLVGLGLGMLIGSAAHTTHTSTLGGMTMTSRTPEGIGIGAVVGGAVGGAVALMVYARSRHFYMEVGSALEMVLPRTVTLASKKAIGEGSTPAPTRAGQTKLNTKLVGQAP